MLRIAGFVLLFIQFLAPGVASAQITWNSSSWTITPSTSVSDPNYSSASTTINSATTDLMSVSLSSSANSDPGPGGPSASATISFSRSFHLASTTTSIPVRAIVSGGLSNAFPAAGAASQFSLTVNTQFGMFYSNSSAGGGTGFFPMSYDQTSNYSFGSLPPGDYTLSGTMTISSSCSSGPGSGGGATVMVGIPGVTPVPEPRLLLSAAVAAVGLRRLRPFGV